MQTINTINQILTELLMSSPVPDFGYNGIQVENSGEIKKVAFAVDVCEETIEKAIRSKCNLLIVHHGLFWGKDLPITGGHYRRIKALIENNVGLLAYHLPLDGHPEVGNNAQILKKLSASNFKPCGFHKGFAVGYIGELEKPTEIADIAKKLEIPSDSLKILPFGKKEVTKVGVLSGGGGHYFQEFVDAGAELFITGDAEHILYHSAKEQNANIIFGGHYYTEIWGVQALQRFIAKELLIDTEFISVPTGL